VTVPAPETLANERDKLFVTDAELIRRLGLPDKIGRAAIQELDRSSRAGRSRFPQKDPLFGHRRFYPAVENYLMLRYGVNDAASQQKEQHYATDDEAGEAGEAGESGNARSRVETPQETLDRVLGAAAGHRR
jgi:hypothetical protein